MQQHKHFKKSLALIVIEIELNKKNMYKIYFAPDKTLDILY